MSLLPGLGKASIKKLKNDSEIKRNDGNRILNPERGPRSLYNTTKTIKQQYI